MRLAAGGVYGAGGVLAGRRLLDGCAAEGRTFFRRTVAVAATAPRSQP